VENKKVVRAPWWVALIAFWWFIKNADGLFRWLSKRGELVKFYIFHRPCFVFNHPELIQQVMVGELREKYDAVTEAMGPLALLIGKTGVLTMPSGPRHKVGRTALRGRLHGEGLNSSAVVMREEAARVMRELVQRARDGQPFDMANLLHAFTMRTLARATFGAELSAETIAATREAVESGLKKTFPRTQQPFGWPLLWQARFRKNIRTLDEIIGKLIRDAILTGRWEKGQDTLSALLQNYFAGEMFAEEVIDNLKNLFIAGHETTATALRWAIKTLSERPDLYDWLSAEVEVARERALNIEDRSRLPRIWAFIDEVMRLTPTAPRLARTAIETHEVWGIKIPRESIIFFSALDIQRNDELWGRDACQFRPSRFLEKDGEARQRLKWAFFPFGGGNRRCLGEAFALFEMATFLIALIESGLKLLLIPQPLRIVSGFTRKLESLRMTCYAEA